MRKSILILMVLSICISHELRNLVEADILNEIKNIHIPIYENPIKKGLTICNIVAKGTQIKTVQSTVSNIQFDLANAGLDESESKMMKSIIFASSLAYLSFHFEVRKSVSDFNLKYSLFVGLAKREKDSIKVVFVDAYVTAYLYYHIPNIYMHCERDRDPSCPPCRDGYSQYCKFNHKEEGFFFKGPRTCAPSIVPNPDDIYSISNYLKEYAKNVLLK